MYQDHLSVLLFVAHAAKIDVLFSWMERIISKLSCTQLFVCAHVKSLHSLSFISSGLNYAHFFRFTGYSLSHSFYSHILLFSAYNILVSFAGHSCCISHLFYLTSFIFLLTFCCCHYTQ